MLGIPRNEAMSHNFTLIHLLWRVAISHRSLRCLDEDLTLRFLNRFQIQMYLFLSSLIFNLIQTNK